MSEHRKINEEELEELLKGVFLEEGAALPGDVEFVLGQEYDVKIDAAKEKAVIEKLTRDQPSWFSRYFPAGLGFAVVFELIFMFFHVEHSIHSGNKTAFDADAKIYITANGKTYGLKEYTDSVADHEKAMIEMNMPPPVAENYRQIVSYYDSAGKAAVSQPAPEQLQEQKAAPVAPVLIEREVARFRNLKSQMFSKLASRDKKVYTTLIEGKVDYKGKGVEVTSFAMRNFEVTNIEYKAFLVDLLLQGRTEDYKKAQVNTAVWNNYGLSGLAADYFTDERYDDFPVVSISADAAKLFCQWLEAETNAWLKKNNPKAKLVKVRLPYDVEWIHAAWVGTAQVPDCGGYNTIFDVKEGAVDKAFVRRMATVKRHHGRKNDSADYFYSINRYGMNEGEIAALFKQGLEYANSTPADTLYPRRMKTLCKVGHVSELILEQASGQVTVMGSCWSSKEQFFKMKGEFTRSSASPFIGFRPVIIAEDATEYKRPFW